MTQAITAAPLITTETCRSLATAVENQVVLEVEDLTGSLRSPFAIATTALRSAITPVMDDAPQTKAADVTRHARPSTKAKRQPLSARSVATGVLGITKAPVQDIGLERSSKHIVHELSGT